MVEEGAIQYRIGKFARVSGVTVKTLRFYDEIGLLRPASVNPLTGYRSYLPAQLEELAAILALRELGVSLAEIGAMKRKAGTGAGRSELLKQVRSGLKKTMQTAARMLRWIDAELDQMSEAIQPVAVVVKQRPAMLIASVRRKVASYEEIEGLGEMLLRAVPREAIAEPGGVLWHRCADSGTLEGEPFVALKRAITSGNNFKLRELPFATLACAYAKPDNDSAELAYEAIRQWIGYRGYRVMGAKREIYLDGALEIQFPVNAA